MIRNLIWENKSGEILLDVAAIGDDKTVRIKQPFTNIEPKIVLIDQLYNELLDAVYQTIRFQQGIYILDGSRVRITGENLSNHVVNLTLDAQRDTELIAYTVRETVKHYTEMFS